jgi:dolichol-phosphate mannosyltransferase
MTNQASGVETLIVIPTYNERGNIERLIARIFEFVPHAKVWIVDDDSPDGTGKVVDDMAKEDSRIACFHRPAKSGLGTAYAEAFQRVLTGEEYQFVVEMDADFSHDPAILPDLLREAQGVDLVLGSRYVSGGSTPDWSVHRRTISWVANLVARYVLGLGVHDATTGFRVYSRRALETMHLSGVSLRGYGFQIETVYQCSHAGLTIREYPIRFMDRSHGHSKMSKAIVVEALLYVFRRRLVALARSLSLNKPQNVGTHDNPSKHTDDGHQEVHPAAPLKASSKVHGLEGEDAGGAREGEETNQPRPAQVLD